jgi:hypothetical protein
VAVAQSVYFACGIRATELVSVCVGGVPMYIMCEDCASYVSIVQRNISLSSGNTYSDTILVLGLKCSFYNALNV